MFKWCTGWTMEMKFFSVELQMYIIFFPFRKFRYTYIILIKKCWLQPWHGQYSKYCTDETSWRVRSLAHSTAGSRNPLQSFLILIWPLKKLFRFVLHIHRCTNNGWTKYSIEISWITHVIVSEFGSEQPASHSLQLVWFLALLTSRVFLILSLGE